MFSAERLCRRPKERSSKKAPSKKEICALFAAGFAAEFLVDVRGAVLKPLQIQPQRTIGNDGNHALDGSSR